MSTQDTKARVGVLVIQFLTLASERELRKRGEKLRKSCFAESYEGADAAASYFRQVYAVAGQFCFTREYRDSREIRWLGLTVDSDTGAAMHHVLVRDRFHDTLQLHQHVLFPGSTDLTGNDGDLERRVRSLWQLYWGPIVADSDRRDELQWVLRLDPFSDLLTQRLALVSAGRQIYVSAVMAASASTIITEWENYATQLYSLLHQHARGVDAAPALQQLRSTQWGQSNSAISFFQPSGFLTVSNPPPVVNAESSSNQEYWNPFPFGLDDFPEALAALRARMIFSSENGLERYNYLPPFPLVRHTVAALMEYLGTAEYEQARIRGDLDRIAQRTWVGAVVGGIREMRRLDKSFFRSTSVEILRLSASQGAARRLQDTKPTDLSEKMIETMRTSLLNNLLVLIAVLGLVVACVQVVEAVV